MKKHIALILTLALVVCAFAGCAGTPVVYYTNCTCPTDGQAAAPEQTTPATDPVAVEGELKTGLAIIANAAESENAVKAKYDVTIAAVTVDANGVIADCVIDSIGTEVAFDATGAVTSDLTAAIPTKTELGDDYGMVAWGGAVAEWYQQADALAQFAIGKTVEELKSGAIDETGKAPAGTDLATTATIYLGGYVSAIEAAVANAQNLGAQAGDKLKLAVISDISGSKSADAENAGLAQLYTSVAALTMNEGVITSCMLDAVQAKVEFDATGTITTDLAAEILTKNQLGENYGMKAWGGAIAEWNEQAASFAAYITEKTPAEVAGIAVDEKTAPTEADLVSSVTIKIGTFMDLIAKAAQ